MWTSTDPDSADFASRDSEARLTDGSAADAYWRDFRADDYTDGTTNVPVEGGYGPNYGSATITLEQIIKHYTGPLGGFISRNGCPYMAVIDGPFITARTTPDGYPAALLALARLHGAGRLPAKYVVDGDGLGHEPTAAEIRRNGA